MFKDWPSLIEKVTKENLFARNKNSSWFLLLLLTRSAAQCPANCLPPPSPPSPPPGFDPFFFNASLCGPYHLRLGAEGGYDGADTCQRVCQLDEQTSTSMWESASPYPMCVANQATSAACVEAALAYFGVPCGNIDSGMYTHPFWKEHGQEYAL